MGRTREFIDARRYLTYKLEMRYYDGQRQEYRNLVRQLTRFLYVDER